MPLHGCNPTPVWRWRLLAAGLILVSSALHVAYLIHDCPLDLAPDEAHYWDWSRHLDWSYYSKGPLVALLIRGSCALFGPWSEALTGTQVLAVRLPAIVCGALLLASLYVLTVQTLGRERLAAAVVALTLTLPLVAAGAGLMTIDAPYTALWGWALVFGHAAAVRGRAWAWPLAFVGGQFGLLLGYWFAVWACALWAYRPWRTASGPLPPCGGGLGWGVDALTPHPHPPPQGGRGPNTADSSRRYLWWLSVPT